VASAAATLLAGVDALFRSRRAGFMQTITDTVGREMPGAPESRVRELAQQELTYELEFQRKVKQRLERDLPEALRTPGEAQRALAVGKILDREKRYVAQREQAAAGRVVGALEMDLLRQSSPQGAYWQLSPLIREHCPRCLAMAGKFWPWEVLDMPGVHLPIHPNCGCRLLGLEEAVSQGLMAADQIPDTEDAIRRAKHLLQEAERLERTLGPEELARAIDELESDRIQEVSARQLLRWTKGYEKGGEFRPRGGGNPGQQVIKGAQHDLDSLRALVQHETPLEARGARRGEMRTIKGAQHFIPHADHWSEHIGGVRYQSPAGGTHLYRNGILMGPEHPDLQDGVHVPTPRKPGVPVDDPRHRYDEDTAPRVPVLGIPDYTGQRLTIGMRAGGSTGAVWATDPQGDKWLVKTYGGDQDRIATELLSNALYREMGADVAEAGTWGAPGLPAFEKIPDAIDEPKLPKAKRISTGMIVREPDGKLWVYEPKGHFGGYEHSFPKGGLEDGLSPQQNAHKELWEETGLHAKVVAHVGDYKGDTGTTRYYLAVRTGGEPHAPDPTPFQPGGSETAAVKLVTPDQARELLNRDRDRSVLKDALDKGDSLTEEQLTPPADEFPPAGEVPALTYQALPGQSRFITEPSAELGAHYMTDALLANWDFIGMGDDNVLWSGTRPVRLDQGGTLQFRAQGAHKPFGPVPSEVWSLQSPKGGQGFGKVQVSESQMRDQARQIEQRLTPDRIDTLVDQAPFQDTRMREEVRQALKDRIAWMGRFADGDEALPQPLEGTSARAAMASWQSELEPRPEQHAALTNYLSDAELRAEVQTGLRAGTKKSEVSEPVRRTVKELDSLLRHQRTDDDVTVYLPWPGEHDTTSLIGQTMTDRGYMTATTSRGEARSAPTMIQVTVPSGARALYTPQVEGVDEAVGGQGVRAELPLGEVMLPRGTRLRIVGADTRAGRNVVQAVLIPS
jgi:8-oxo-dGTP pyrophosphatase MutT (NUDIX family)